MASSYSTMQSILPDILPTTTSQKRRSKKHVRFALTLESVDENSVSPIGNKSVLPTTKPNNRIMDTWREDGPLYGAYVEYLEKKDALTAEMSEMTRPIRPLPPPEPEVEVSTYTHTFVIQSISPELVIDSVTISTPPLQLPRIVSRIATAKKSNNIRRESLSLIDSCIKPRIKLASPSRHIQSRKASSLVNNKNQSYPAIKRADTVLPGMKDLNSNEKSVRTENYRGAKTVNDYLQTKKVTEVIPNPLSTTNNQIHHVSGRSPLPNRSKKSQIPCHNHTNNDTYFFQNHNNDHFQPIIHSTH
jgi:hypothetical protein